MNRHSPFPPPTPQRHYLALVFPVLSADRWLREQGGAGEGATGMAPLVFVEKQRGAMRIMAASEVALGLGLSTGMMLADARARVPDLVTVAFDAAADATLLDQVADWCDRYTPSVAVEPPDGITLDLTGCLHLWGGERDLLTDLATRLGFQGFTLRAAFAGTPDRARALARHGGHVIAVNRHIPPSALNDPQSEWRAPMPVAALELPTKQEEALKRAGLYTIDDLAARPRSPLAARFGAAAVAKLARVLGEEDVRLSPRRTAPAIFTLHRFAEPVARTAYMLDVIAMLAEEAQQSLRERGEGGRAFTVSLFRSDGDTRRLRIETGRPTHDPALLIRLFRERIEALADPLDPGFGYDAIRLDVMEAEKLAPAQPGLLGEREAGEGIAALTDRLGVRMGRDRIRRLAFGNSHVPECAGFSVAAHTPVLPLAIPEVEPGEPPARPLHLFDPPQRVETIAEVPDGPPRRFRWRRETHDVIASEGPERIAAEWWKRRDMKGLTRDYYRVEDSAGRRFWLFRHGLYGAEKPNPDWYLHGVFA